MPSTDPSPSPAAPARAAAARTLHWRRSCGLTLALLLAWAVVGFGVTWFARDLDADFFGWPFSFWVAAQGGLLVFVGLLVLYAHGMARIDRRLVAAGGGAADDAHDDDFMDAATAPAVPTRRRAAER